MGGLGAMTGGAPEQRPRVYVGGLTHEPEVALAIQHGLETVAEVTVGGQESRLSASVVDTFTETLERADFAVFVVPDRSGGREADRDAFLQLGMMIGLLGRDRTLVVVPAGATAGPTVPATLLGLGVAEYDPHRADGNVRAAVGIATGLIRETLNRLGPRTSNDPVHDFPAAFERHLQRAGSIVLWGMNQSDFFIRHLDLLEGRLRAGAVARGLLATPDGAAVRLTRLRFPGTVDENHESYRARTSLTQLCRLRAAFPDQVEVRVLDYPFSYGGFLLDDGTPDAVAYTKQYTFRVTGGSKKPKAVHAYGRTGWYAMVRQEVEHMWEAGSSWECAPGSSSSAT